MLKTNVDVSQAQILLIALDTRWTNELSSYLTDAGYQVVLAATAEAAMSIPDIEVVLLVAESTQLGAFVRFKDRQEPPLIAWVSEDFRSVNCPPYIDLLLPPAPRYVEQHLRLFLRLRKEASLLREQNTVLQEEITQLGTELEQQKRTVDEVEVLKNAIVRNVSHELKTPLLQVKSAVALISEDVKDSKLIDYATNATTRLETLVKNITLLGSSLDVILGPVIIRDAVEYSRRNLRRIWQHKDDVERITMKLEANLPAVQADKQGISTVLQLLMDNALKFSKDIVEVTAVHVDDQVRVAVVDHGIGIAKDQLGLIFDSFYQVEHSSTRRYGGTGVGLAIAKLILDHHGSQIMVDTEVGKGSTFSFLLPIARF